MFSDRLDAAGLTVERPLTPVELSAALRVRSDPGRAAQIATLTRSLAAASKRGALEWGPMVLETERGHVRVDGTYHRSYRVAGWPQLPVGSDWLGELLTDTRAVRTVTVVMEPVPMGRAARAADREVMAREADADMKTQKGFRVNARERKRLADVEARERELSEGHAEFHFVGIVDVTAADLDALDDTCADVEQAAAQSPARPASPRCPPRARMGRVATRRPCPRPPRDMNAQRAGSGVVDERPPLWRPAKGLRIERHRATMAHLASVYPCHTDTSIGERGPYIGVNVTGGGSGWYFDPFELYGTGVLTNPNCIVTGDIGSGKSALVKAFLGRELAVYGPRRMVTILDPKGEYTPFARAHGLPVIRLHPGGTDRLNPMDHRGDPTETVGRQGLATALVAGVLGRALDATEDALLGWSVATLARTGRTFTLADVAATVADPADELVALSRRTPLELAQAATPVVFALDKLLTRTLAGMFDGPTTVHVDWANGPGFVIDLSAVYGDDDALPSSCSPPPRGWPPPSNATRTGGSCKSSTKRGLRFAMAPATSKAA